jgi:predicted RNA-binding Zn ribbon-like protein
MGSELDGLSDYMLNQVVAATRLVRLAIDVRAAQARYFRTRLREDLIASKDLERAFDKLAAEYAMKFPIDPEEAA